MQRSIARGALVVAAAALAGCSLFVDDTGLSGASDGGAALDGASADSSAPPDGDGDATIADGASNDAGSDAPAVPFCSARAAAFCDDFEHDTVVPTWTAMGVNGATVALTIESGLSTSPTRALVASLGPDAGGDCNYAQAEKQLAGSFHGFHVAFNAYVEPFSGRMTLAAPYIGTPNDRCYAYLFDDDGTLSVYGQYAQGGSTLAENNAAGMGTLATGKWVHLELDYDFATKKVTVSRDGVAVTSPLAFNCPLVPGAAVLQLGFSCEASPPNVHRARFDDVTFDPR